MTPRAPDRPLAGTDLAKSTSPEPTRDSRTLFERWLALRDRVVASPRFQRFVARFLPTRFIARRHAAALFDLCAGFVYSQVLVACVQLRLFEALADEPRSATDLAGTLAVPVDAMTRLLEAAVSLRLCERRRGERYGLALAGAAYLGNPAIAQMVTHHALLYEDLRDPVALLRGSAGDTSLRRFWTYAGAAPASNDVTPYSELMAGSLPLIAADILDAYPLDRHRRLLDVGGGKGVFLTAVAARAPHLSLVLFDLPAVTTLARAHLARNGLHSVEIAAGDARSDALPTPVDVVTFVRILHDHDDDAVLAMLRAARAALAPGGVVLVAEPMAARNGRQAVGAYFGFYLLAMGQGRPRSPEEICALLLRAGFDSARPRATNQPLLAQLVVGRVR